ncbi:DUF4870 domain-containing protein [Haloechinothrix sp. YIM 98757]|uniref:DUF4870 domain-containing protein n=1 Tax=Haloechinothrix aidingensis TaxID=2752311 RepID=A0A838A7R5_9PSEU|nr:DUF4870 domain-containing protein [Haloechinothrix aidingensis]MBA0124359.1 DUF4870 domain-containing protein [Haloechinothrix aidingensis]
MSTEKSFDNEPRHEQPGQHGSEGTLDPQVGGLLSYLLFGWIGGLIMFFTQKHREVRFHAAQSILLSIALLALYIALGIISTLMMAGPFGWALFSFVYTVLGLAVFALWVVLCVKGYKLQHFKLPVIGDIAEGWARS